VRFWQITTTTTFNRKQTSECQNVRFGPLADISQRNRYVRFNSKSPHTSALVSDPAPHALNVLFIGRSELMAHLGFLERNVDPIGGSEDGDGRNKHWPCAHP